MRFATLEAFGEIWSAWAPDHGNTTTVHIFKGAPGIARVWKGETYLVKGKLQCELPPGVAPALEIGLGEF